MPLYLFKCRNCNIEFEEQMSLSEFEKERATTCVDCDGKAEVVISNPGHYKHLSWQKWRVGMGT